MIGSILRFLGIRGHAHSRWPRVLSRRFFLLSIVLVATIVFQSRRTESDFTHKDDTRSVQSLEHGAADHLDVSGREQKHVSSKTLVVARRKHETTHWINRLPPSFTPAIYTVDDPETGTYEIPRNKGRESMVYLSYIIDHYSSLSDITVFVHGDANSWHNEPVMKNDMVTMLTRLNDERVLRDGYFNLRCTWHPGCPSWISLEDSDGDSSTSNNLEEIAAVRATWHELHARTDEDGDNMPQTVSQPCCSQFAVSRATIHSVSLDKWLHYRSWLLSTSLSDHISGRVWEYTWQYILTGNGTFCPDERRCYCDGYKICFGGEVGFCAWEELKARREELYSKYLRVRGGGGDDLQLQRMLKEAEGQERGLVEEAMKRGIDPVLRRAEL